MGLLNWFFSLLFGSPRRAASPPTATSQTSGSRSAAQARGRVRLKKDRPRQWSNRYRSTRVVVPKSPYPFARKSITGRGYLDMSTDGDDQALVAAGLPIFHHPQELADWLRLPLKELAWLTNHFRHGRPVDERRAHYHFRWIEKRRGGWRLIESPKRLLKAVQSRILDEILSRIATHPAVHGFVPGRSILTNAEPHVGQDVVVKLDLESFYPSIRLARIIRLFRGMGYSREAAIWLGRLVTSRLPLNQPFPTGKSGTSSLTLWPYFPAHLPQGAPTSPALSNLVLSRLDARLAGLARKFGATYTRYADDLTFSGPERFAASLTVFLPLAKQIIRREGLRVNRGKTRVLRQAGRQIVTGVVVNERPNIDRRAFDTLKAILTNCRRHGPTSQNRDNHPQFALHLRGRIGHVALLNPARGAKLLAIFQQIDWER